MPTPGRVGPRRNLTERVLERARSDPDASILPTPPSPGSSARPLRSAGSAVGMAFSIRTSLICQPARLAGLRHRTVGSLGQSSRSARSRSNCSGWRSSRTMPLPIRSTVVSKPAAISSVADAHSSSVDRSPAVTRLLRTSSPLGRYLRSAAASEASSGAGTSRRAGCRSPNFRCRNEIGTPHRRRPEAAEPRSSISRRRADPRTGTRAPRWSAPPVTARPAPRQRSMPRVRISTRVTARFRVRRPGFRIPNRRTV